MSSASVLPFSSPAEVAAALPRVTEHLQADGLLAYPTETVYGLGSTTGDAAVDALAALKGNRVGKHFLILIADLSMLDWCGVILSKDAETLARHFWPGPLTLVLPVVRPTPLAAALRNTAGGVAVRWTPLPSAQQIVSALGQPITSTSANRSAASSCGSGQEIAAEWKQEVREGKLLVLDAGVKQPSPPSTIVDCSTGAITLTRRGVVSQIDIAALVPDLIVKV